MSDEQAKLRALPRWGGGPIPGDRDRDVSEDAYSFTTVIRLFLRSWPFIHAQIGGEWRERAVARWPRSDAAPSHGWMPPVLTAVWAAGWLADLMTVGPDARRAAQLWSEVGSGSLVALVACAWLTLALRGWPRVVVSGIGVGAGLLGVAMSWIAIQGPAPKLYAFGLWAVFIAGWFVRLGARDRVLYVAARLKSHMVYLYTFQWLGRLITLATSAYLIGLLYQNVLQGHPLTELMAAVLGRPEYASGVTESLTAAQRHDVKWLYVYLGVGVWFVQLPFRLLLPVYTVWILQQINQDLRLALVERWHRLSLRYHSDHRVGDSVYRVYQDSAQVTSVIGRLIAVVTQLSSLVACVVILTLLDPVIGVLCLLIGFPVLGWGHWFSPRMRVRSLVARETNSDLTSSIQEIFGGIRVIKAYQTEAREQERFEGDSAVAFNAAFRARSLVAVITIVTFTITAAFLLSAEFRMGLLGSQGSDTFATGLLLLIGVAFARWNVSGFDYGKRQLFDAATDVRGLAREWAVGQDMAMGLHRVFGILDLEPDVPDAPDAPEMQPFRREVRFENVSFGYAPDQPVLRDVSFAAPAGSVTAIVGPTGAGKSTLVTLLLRLFDPDRGRVLVDGVDVRTLRVESLRGNVSIALQENLLFAMSVADNIRYAVPGASDEQVREAARVACADEFIEALPQGYETVLGDRGGRLSTGQRQRLSIARAIVKDSPILVLDEPTAALDAETEHRVLSNIAEWGAGRAVFIITHRLSTVRRADQILLLRDGELREVGRHEELMRLANGSYRQLVDVETALAAGGGD